VAHVILITRGTGGDILPLIGIGQSLRQCGHQVTLGTHWYFRTLVQGLGLGFAALDSPEDLMQSFGESAPGGTPHKHMADAILGYMALSGRGDYEIIRGLAGSRESVIVAHPNSFLGSRLAAEKLRIPYLLIFTAPTFIKQHMLLSEYKRELSPLIAKLREECGLPPVADWRAWLKAPPSSIGLWPEWFDPETKDCWPPGMVCVGFMHHDPALAADPPEELRALLDEPEPPILITHGTSIPKRQEFYTASAEACRRLGRRAIIVTQHEACVPDPLPEGVVWFRSLPFESVMPRVGAVISHGGIGTSAQALAAGVPQVILAHAWDRPENAACLQSLGVAEFVPLPRWRPEEVAASLRRMTDSAEVRERCRELARRMAGASPADEAADVIVRALQQQTDAPEPESSRGVHVPPANAGKQQAQPRSISSRLHDLSPDKRALLILRLKEQARAGAPESTTHRGPG
jgi:UDP:flavonoid glycosyltransferase YjiC (YdhE family)